MSARIPQFAKSDDPEVIQTIRANDEGLAKYHDEACAFAMRFGAETGAFHPSRMFGQHAIRAIAVKTRPTEGQWSKGYRGFGFRPRKGTDLEREMDAIRFTETLVPGLLRTVDGPGDGDGGMRVGSPTTFVHDGIAYAGLSFMPAREQSRTFNDADEPKSYGEQWTEITGGEFQDALDAYNAARRAATR